MALSLLKHCAAWRLATSPHAKDIFALLGVLTLLNVGNLF